jgi:hypothetical protein
MTVPGPVTRPISERVPFDPRYEFTRYEAAMLGEVSWGPNLYDRWLLPDGSTVTERELLEAEGGIGGPEDRS